MKERKPHFTGWVRSPPKWQWEIMCHGGDDVSVASYLHQNFGWQHEVETLVLTNGETPFLSKNHC